MSRFHVVSIFSVFLFSCFLQSKALPIVTITRNDGIVLLDLPPAEEEVVKETFSQLISSILKPVFNKLLLLFCRQLMSMMIGIEILTISNGNHFGMIVPQLDAQADLELHQKAMAVMELWLQLPTAEIIESAAQKATLEVAELVGHAILKDVPVDADVTQKIIQLVLEKIEHRLKTDQNTYTKFLDAKNRIHEQFSKLEDHRTFFSSGEKMTLKKEKEIFKQWFSDLRIKKFMVNKLFVLDCLKQVPRPDDNDYENIILAKAIIRLAKIPERTAEVNKIYQRVVFELADEFNYEKYKLGGSSSLGGFNPNAFANETTPIMYKKLREKLSENNSLYTDLLTQKSTVIGDAILKDMHPINNGLW